MAEQEKQQLLLSDLSSRLVYGIYVKDKYNDKVIYDLDYHPNLYDCIPYLRPMSSMTDEEMKELKQEHFKDNKLFAECLKNAVNGDNSMRGKVIPHFASDWCNKNYFDYCGLIDKGLALEAPEGMYK